MLLADGNENGKEFSKNPYSADHLKNDFVVFKQTRLLLKPLDTVNS